MMYSCDECTASSCINNSTSTYLEEGKTTFLLNLNSKEDVMPTCSQCTYYITALIPPYSCLMSTNHQVSLIHITPNAEELISYMARVSNPSNQSNTKTSAKLIKYLIDHQHWSPFEMVNMCVEINTTRSIAAQILRHRSFSFQEFSQRYAKVAAVSVMPELRRQDHANRQNSINDLPSKTKDVMYEMISGLFDHSERVYNELLEAGVAKECAREVLPLATPTRLYMNGSIRSWLHYCDLRTGNGTQKEHAVIAGQVQDILYSEIPNICEAMWCKD